MKRFIILFFIIALSSACSVKREVAEVWNYVQEQPDSALFVLNSLNASSYAGRTLANYQLLKAMALDKNYIDVASDSLARPAYEFFHRHGPKEKEMMSLYYLGVSQFYAKDYNRSIVTLNQARDLADYLSNARYLGLIESCKSYVFHHGYDYADAIQSINQAIGYFSSLPDSILQIRRAKMQLADIYISNRQFSEAYHLYDDILAVAPKDTFLQRRGLQNMAWSLFLSDSNRSEEALSLIQEAIAKFGAGMDYKQFHHYGAVLIETGHLDRARDVIGRLETNNAPSELIADLRYRLCRRQEDYKSALEQYVTLLDYQNDFARNAMRQSLVKSQRDYYKKEKERAEQELYWKRKTLTLIIIISLLCALIVFVLLFFWHRKVTESREQLMLNINDTQRLLNYTQNRNSVLEEELDTARRRYVTAYKKQFQKISSLLEYYYETSDKKDGRDMVYRQVMELSTMVGKDRQSMKSLERSVNNALDNAFRVYQQEYPGKSQEHYNLVCYFMAGFPASFIGMLTSMPRNTVYSKKQRLLELIKGSKSVNRDLLLRAIQ